MSAAPLPWEEAAQASAPLPWEEAAGVKSAPAQPSAASRFGSNFASGAGVTSAEGAKQFFTHPLDTLWSGFERQGGLAKAAADAYKRGNYMEAATHALNYMVPFIGQQTDVAGQQLQQGDIAGGVGRTLGVGANVLAGSPEGQAAIGSAAAKTGAAARVVGGAVKDVAKNPETIATAVGGTLGAKAGTLIGQPVGGGLAGGFIGREIGKAVAKRLVRPGQEAAAAETPLSSLKSPQPPTANAPVSQAPAQTATATQLPSNATLQDLLDKSLSATQLQKNVPLRQQLPGLKPPSVQPTGVKGALAEIDNAYPLNPLNPGAGTVPKEYAVMGTNGPEATFTVSESSGKLRLNGIQSLKPGSGAGTKALQDITNIADKHNVDMELTASPYGDEGTALSKDALIKWYGKQGFEPKAGTNPASGYMVRTPQGLPSGFTAANSSVLKAYKYNPSSNEMETITNNGGHYIYGDVSPEQAQALSAAQSKGQAWNAMRNQSPLVAKVLNGKRVPIKPVAASSTEDLTPILQQSLAKVKQKSVGGGSQEPWEMPSPQEDLVKAVRAAQVNGTNREYFLSQLTRYMYPSNAAKITPEMASQAWDLETAVRNARKIR